MVSKYKARNRDTLIEQRNQNSLTHIIKNKDLTTEDKTNIVTERNPYLHIFGSPLTQPHYEETYTDWINRQYLGEPDHITTIEEARDYLVRLRTTEVHGG